MAATDKQTGEFVFTGKHFLAIIVSFFAVVITVNFTMAYYASKSWSGLVAENTYVASQQFNTRAAAMREMMATGIRGELRANHEGIHYTLTHPTAGTVDGDEVVAAFHRPVGTEQDFTVKLDYLGKGVFKTDHPVAPGEWIVDLKTTAKGEMVYHEAIRVHVFANK